MNIIFLRTRYDYAPYGDWFKLVELSGFPTVFFDDALKFDSKDTVFIATAINGEWNFWPKRYTEGRFILYQLELNVDGNHTSPACVDEVWNGDVGHSKLNGFRYVPLGGHSGLCEDNSDRSKDFDVSFLAYQVYRRQHITNAIKALGLRVAPTENLWGIDRSVTLRQSKILTHVHQWEQVPSVAPLRWCIAAAHRLPMITETVEDRGIFGFTYMMQCDYDFIPEFVEQVIKPENHYKLEDYGGALHSLLCEKWTFKKMIEANL